MDAKRDLRVAYLRAGLGSLGPGVGEIWREVFLHPGKMIFG